MPSLSPMRSLRAAVVATIVTTAAFGASVGASPSQFTAAQLKADIAQFEHTLWTKGSVDLSRTPGLVHQIEASPTDWPSSVPITGSNCMPKKTTAPTVNACTYGDPSSTTTVVLFGDSHLEQYLDVYVGLAASRHWHLVTFFRGNCGAAQATASPSHQSSEALCQQWRVKAFAAIAKAKPAMVVIGQSDDALPGKPKLAAADERSTLTTLLGILHGRADRLVTMVDQTEDDYPDGVSDEANCLARSGLTVTYDPKDGPTKMHDDTGVCYRIYRQPYHSAAMDVRAAVAAVDQQVGVVRIDPNPWLCDTTATYGVCPPVILGTLVYHDPWHLSATFVARLANLIAAKVPSP